MKSDAKVKKQVDGKAARASQLKIICAVCRVGPLLPGEVVLPCHVSSAPMRSAPPPASWPFYQFPWRCTGQSTLPRCCIALLLPRPNAGALDALRAHRPLSSLPCRGAQQQISDKGVYKVHFESKHPKAPLPAELK